MKRRPALLTLSSAVIVPRLSLQARELTGLRVLGQPVDPCGPLFYAKDLGSRRPGWTWTSVRRPTWERFFPRLIGGSADIAYSPVTPAEQAFKRGLGTTTIAPAAINDARHPTNFLVVAKDSPSKSAKDLNGKTPGTSPLESLGTYAADAWCDQHGGDSSTHKWADVPFQVDGEALSRAHRRRCYCRPFATMQRATTRLPGRPYEAISPYFLEAGYFTTPAWAVARPDVLRRFQEALHEAAM